MEYTRKDYLDGKCTHREFYAQFVDDHTREAVLRRFSAIGLRAALDIDEHLNSISLRHWDKLADSCMSGGSLSDRVCVIKEAAKQVAEA